MPFSRLVLCFGFLLPSVLMGAPAPQTDAAKTEFFERNIRPLLVKHCYECHSEKAGERQGGLLLDRETGWRKGGDTQKAVVPGNLEASLLVRAIRYDDENLQMPPEAKLSEADIKLFETWIKIGAPGPAQDLKESEFSRLGDQEFLFEEAKTHWAFQPVKAVQPPAVPEKTWNEHAIDRFVYANLEEQSLTPSPRADSRTLLRRLHYDLTGLPPSWEELQKYSEGSQSSLSPAEYEEWVDRLIDSPAFGEHIGRMWLDVARYADTDSFYRPDTRTPHYFPFAFTYRDYVIQAFNHDKPYNEFLQEQLAIDLMKPNASPKELAALGFLTVGPHANRNSAETLDDWIDVTTRGLMGMTAACARCHDHKYEPIPTTDYYALRGVFNSVVRINPLAEDSLPEIPADISPADQKNYEKKRASIDAKINKAGGSKSKNNNRSIAQKIRETELAELLAFHPGAPVRTMIVKERSKPVPSYVFLRGEPSRRGDDVPRRFLSILDHSQAAFSETNSGRLELAKKITDPQNPVTARVFVNRVWGHLMGSYFVETPSDFGVQGAKPTHPELLDWLAADFVEHGWSVKHLVRRIVLSQTYQQRSQHREAAAAIDPTNQTYWRANRKHLSVEALRDSLLTVSGHLDRTIGGRPAMLWGDEYTQRRAVYGFINRFNLDPTLRVFGFPTPMQTQPTRKESIVAPQALFTMNSPFVIDQANHITQAEAFQSLATPEAKIDRLFTTILQRQPTTAELDRIVKFLDQQQSFYTQAKSKNRIPPAWQLVAQSLMMSNEFQYID